MGKALEKRFGGTPYGWERDMLRLILATLFRAGEIEVTYQGNRFHNYQDPASRTPFTNNPAFRSSLFSPRQSVGLKTLTQAVQQLEDLTGEEVDVEEGAIATAFKKVAAEKLEKLYPLKATAEAHRLPILSMLSEYQQTLVGIQSSASDDCVRILTENGKDFGETREKVRKLRESLNAEAIGVLRQTRLATDQVWQRLAAHNPSPEIAATVEELKTTWLPSRSSIRGTKSPPAPGRCWKPTQRLLRIIRPPQKVLRIGHRRDQEPHRMGAPGGQESRHGRNAVVAATGSNRHR